MKNPINRKTFLLVAVLASMAVSVHAQNLVQNPGFETGMFAPAWINAGDTTFDSVSTAAPNSGIFAANLGSTTLSTLTQFINTIPGQLYNVSFFLRNDAGIGPLNNFTAAFAGVVGVSITPNSPSFPYTQFSFNNVLAPTASTALVFTARNGPGFWRLDDVSVRLVPEPSTAALLGVVAAGALGLRVWRKRKAA